jgi:NTP pyrophosphatase (non-canonical NTP hydrolase)|tara:strand:- start:158 stop:403 length:246 start_codon:yes stop_codon:yes gene_type:complete
MNELEELMVVTMEECGELIQACSKAIRRDKYYDNKKILEEVGDVMCMLELMHEFDLFSWDDVDARVEVKREKLKKWSNLVE